MESASHSRSWVRALLPRLTAASGIGYLATAYTVSRWLTRRSPAHPAPPSNATDFSVETLHCATSDGLTLHGWVCSPAQPHATVALFHGLRGNRSQLLDRIAFLAPAGYRCVAFDHRAHGQSSGRQTSFGYHESRDVHAVAELILRRWPTQPRAALGVSMGAAALCFAGERSRCFAALILESLYHDLASAFQHRVGGVYPEWFRHFRRGIIWVTERRLGMRLTQIAPVAHLRKLAPRPVLLLTGSEDRYAPPEEVRRLYEQCHEPRAFHLIAGAGHADVCAQGGGAYQELVLEFLRRYLG
jgi:pimeloyl-ACP methyl ester carboxylesterase